MEYDSDRDDILLPLYVWSYEVIRYFRMYGDVCIV